MQSPVAYRTVRHALRLPNTVTNLDLRNAVRECSVCVREGALSFSHPLSVAYALSRCRCAYAV